MNSNNMKIDQKLVIRGSLISGILLYILIILTGSIFSILNIIIPAVVVAILIYKSRLDIYSSTVNGLLIGLFSGVIEILALMTISISSNQFSQDYLVIFLLFVAVGILIGAFMGYVTTFIKNN